MKGRLSYLSIYNSYMPISSSSQFLLWLEAKMKKRLEQRLSPSNLTICLGARPDATVHVTRGPQPIRSTIIPFCSALTSGLSISPLTKHGLPCPPISAHTVTSVALFYHSFLLLGPVPRQLWGLVLYLFPCSLTSHAPFYSVLEHWGATSTLLRPLNTPSMWLPTSSSTSRHLVNWGIK